MSIFGSQSQGPTRINQVQINQSVLGYALAVLMGGGKIQQTILWVDGFQFTQSSGGGKGMGGGKGSNQDYTADVIAALCDGGEGISGIGDVWSGQSWLSNTASVESYTIVAGTPYTPAQAAALTADMGVSANVAHSGTFTDLGAGSASTTGGVFSVPLQRVPYGTLLTAGQYSIDPATNKYYFAAANVGTTVQIGYSFALGIIKKQDRVLIPSSGSVEIGGSIKFHADGGVQYYDPAGGPTNGQAVPGYTVSGSAPATYRFRSADIGKEVLITYQVDDSSGLAAGASTSVGFALQEGTPGQSPYAQLLTNYPGAALGYTGVATVGYFPMDLGSGAQLQQNTFEVFTADGWGGGIVDCSPVQCILQVLTNQRWGLGAGPVPFPASAIDTGAAGTWGNPVNTGTARLDSTAVSWFAANGFFISPVIDKQDTAASLIGRWLEAGQCAAFMSEGLLKLVPYGDTTTAGNGATWVAPSAFAASLDDTCFIPKSDGEDPVMLSSSPWQDAYNTVQVQWNNRAAQYSSEITQESDQAAINRYGSRIEDPQSWDFITTLPAATFAANLRVKRSVYIRNQYEFTLDYRYSFLEPMDIVDITTSSSWATSPNTLGIQNLPVRIVKVVDNPDGTIDFVCEDYPFGVHQPVLYNKQIAAAESQPNRFADPGDTEAGVFEATSRLTGFQGNQIWIGALGKTADWGSCVVHASTDGDVYKPIGTITAPARLGILGAAFPSGLDPDTVNSLVVNFAENSAVLDSGTAADADLGNTLCFVDGEIIAYSTAAVSGVNQSTASGYIRRGQMGSTIADHAGGTLFLRLDDAILKYTYDPKLYGATIWLKFQSVNNFGNSAQDLATLTPVEFVVPGLNAGTVDAETGLVVSKYLPPNVVRNAACNAVLSSSYTSGAGTSSVSVAGPTGSGWTYIVGSNSATYPSGTVTGLAPGVLGYFIYDTQTGVFLFVPSTSYQNTLNDYYIVLGTITTASSTDTDTGGGASGGGYGGDPNPPPTQ